MRQAPFPAGLKSPVFPGANSMAIHSVGLLVTKSRILSTDSSLYG